MICMPLTSGFCDYRLLERPRSEVRSMFCFRYICNADPCRDTFAAKSTRCEDNGFPHLHQYTRYHFRCVYKFAFQHKFEAALDLTFIYITCAFRMASGYSSSSKRREIQSAGGHKRASASLDMQRNMQQNPNMSFSRSSDPEGPTNLTQSSYQNLAAEDPRGQKRVGHGEDIPRKLQKTTGTDVPRLQDSAKGADNSSKENQPSIRHTGLILVTDKRILISCIFGPVLSSWHFPAYVEAAAQALSKNCPAIHDGPCREFALDASEIAPSRKAIENVIYYYEDLYHTDV